MNRPAILTKPEAYAPSRQNLALFRVYVGYRSLLSIVLLVMLVSPNTRQLVGALNPTLYTSAALGYLATSIPLVGSLSGRFNENQKLMLPVFLVDIVAITLMADSSGGMISDIEALIQTLQEAEQALTALEAFAPSARKIKCVFEFCFMQWHINLCICRRTAFPRTMAAINRRH